MNTEQTEGPTPYPLGVGLGIYLYDQTTYKVHLANQGVPPFVSIIASSPNTDLRLNSWNPATLRALADAASEAAQLLEDEQYSRRHAGQKRAQMAVPA